MWSKKAKGRQRAKGIAGSDSFTEQMRGEVGRGRVNPPREDAQGLTEASRRFLESLDEPAPAPVEHGARPPPAEHRQLKTLKRYWDACAELRPAGVVAVTDGSRGIRVGGVGHGYDPVENIARVIGDALDPTKASGKVRRWADMTEAERDALRKQYEKGAK